jgi:O-antigen/teichoic acid export membrane protein
MGAASMLRMAIQIAIFPIVGHLLGPRAYGQVALVSPFVFFAMLLLDAGLAGCIIRAKDVTKELEGTVLCFSCGISLLLILFFTLFCYPIGLLMREPLFPVLLMGMSSILLLAALNIVPAALLLRAKRYDSIALSDIASAVASIVGISVGISLGWGVWSLVVQQVALWTAKVLVVTIASGWRPHLVFSQDILKEQMAFGSRLLGNRIVSFISGNIDNVLIGACMGSQILGYYALAFQIVSLPAMIISGSVYFTMYSNTSEAQRNGITSPALFLKVLRSTLILGTPVIVGLAVTSQLFIPLLLGSKWIPTINLVMLLAPFGLKQLVTSVTSGVIIGLGRADLALKLALTNATLTVAAIVLGVMFSSSAVAIGVSLAAVVTCFHHFRVIAIEYKTPLREITNAATAPLFASLLMGTAVYIFQQTMHDNIISTITMLLCIVVGIMTYVFVLFFMFHDYIAEDLVTIRTAFRTKRAAGEQQS